MLNERPDVSSETRKRVKEIIKEIEPKTIMLPPSLVVRQSSLRRIISIKGGEFHPEKNARNKKEEAPAQ